VKALRTSGEREVMVLDLPIPRPEPDGVVIKMMATGICGSDLHPYRRPTKLHLDPGFISGHEPSGVISEVGSDVEGWQVGDRVMVYFRRTCGQCVQCISGFRNNCTNRRASYGHQGHDGSHTEYMKADVPTLYRLPEWMSYLEGSLIACQGGTAYAPLVRLGVSGRSVLVVSGLGPVGLLSVLFAKAMGATIVGIDPSAGRREIGLKLGVDVALDPTAGPVGEQLRTHFPNGADALTETSGAASAHEVMGDLLKIRGAAAIVGGGGQTLNMPRGPVGVKELTVFGSSAYPPSQFEEICEFIHRHDVKLSSVVSRFYPLDEGVEAFRVAADANTGKVCFNFE
jgi:threonine dehydrogenase-like Zn-dependent dehydrogenase